MLTVKYDFEELKLPALGEGALFYGQATLESDREDASEFFVSKIVLEGGTRLVASGAGFMGTPDPFAEKLFSLIAAQIQDENTVDGRHAALEWSDAIAGLLESHLGHNSAARLERAFGASLS